MKKRLLALMLVAAMVLGMSTTAMADEVTYASSDAASFEIEKTYDSTEDFVPGETLSFEITANENNPDGTVISIGTDNTYNVTGKENKITVTVPSYSKAGVYNYTIKEIEGNTAGVTYDTTTTIEVAVLVEYNNTNHKLVIGNTTYILKDANGAKIDEFENIFETGDFTVAKDVRGNMANENDLFEITVTLTSEKPVLTPIQVGGNSVDVESWTFVDGVYTYTYVADYSEAKGAVTFADIPVGVNVSVKETEKEMNGYKYVEGEKTFEITTDEKNEVVIVNEKGASVDTGIFVNNMPYFIALALVAFALVAFMRKRREF